MEIVNPEYLISLYTQLRDPTGQSVNEVTSQLNNFLQIPQSILCLFDVIFNVQDPIIRSFAALNIRDYLVIHKKDITDEIILNVRKSIIQSLYKEENSTTRLQIINVISFLINYFPGNWPELDEFLYTENFVPYLSSILQILIILYQKLSGDTILARIQYFINIILAGFQSPDLNCNCHAVSFFYLIMIKINDISQFVVFQEPLFQLFQTIVNSEDAQILTQFLEPISIGMNNNIIFLPTEKVIPFIIPILSSNAEIDIKSPINSLLSLYLQFETDQISIELLQQIFDLETRLAIQLYDLSMHDPTLSWLQDCNSVFSGIYMRIPEETVAQMSLDRFQQLVEQKQPQFLLSAISVLTSAIILTPANFDDLIANFFPQLLGFLGNTDKYVQKFASDQLSTIVRDFSDFITSNLSTIVEAVVYFIQQTGGTQGTHLLSSIMSYATISDEVFQYLLRPVIEWMRSPEPLIKLDAALILSSMIETSQSQVPYFVEEISNTCIALLNESLELHYSAYIVVYSLCRFVPDLMIPYVSQLVPIIMNGIHSTDISVKGEAINLISILPTFLSDFMPIFTEALAISNIEINGPMDDQILSISGAAVEQASILVYRSEDPQLLPPILSAIVHVAGLPSMNCLSCAVKGFTYLINMISISRGDFGAVTNPTEAMVQILIEKLIDSSRYEFSILSDIIAALAEVIRTCGIDILKHEELELITIISSVLTQTMNPYTGALFCDEDILDPISNLFIQIAFSTEGNTKEILDALIPMLSNLLNHKSYQYQVFSMKTFAELISRNSTMSLMPDELKSHLIENMLNRISEGIPNIASAAANFIYQLCLNEESRPLLEKCVYPALNMLMTRLQSVTNLTKENILMRENILLAIASISNYILEDRFPVEDTMPAILRALPIVKQLKFNNEVYFFLNSKSFLVVQPELQLEYIRIYAWIIARPESLLKQMEILVFILVDMRAILERFLNVYPPERQKEIIELYLDNDPYKINCFAALFESLRLTAEKININ